MMWLEVTVHRAGRREGREFPYLMAQWIEIHSTEFLTTPSARLGLEFDHLIALTGRNQITLMRIRGHSPSGPPHPKGLRLRVRLRVRLRILEQPPNSLTHPVNGYRRFAKRFRRFALVELALTRCRGVALRNLINFDENSDITTWMAEP